MPLSAFVEEGDRRGGSIWPLEFELVAGSGAPLFEHPESALLPIADEWIETLECAAAAMLAGCVPARRAAKVDPVERNVISSEA